MLLSIGNLKEGSAVYFFFSRILPALWLDTQASVRNPCEFKPRQLYGSGCIFIILVS